MDGQRDNDDVVPSSDDGGSVELLEREVERPPDKPVKRVRAPRKKVVAEPPQEPPSPPTPEEPKPTTKPAKLPISDKQRANLEKARAKRAENRAAAKVAKQQALHPPQDPYHLFTVF